MSEEKGAEGVAAPRGLGVASGVPELKVLGEGVPGGGVEVCKVVGVGARGVGVSSMEAVPLGQAVCVGLEESVWSGEALAAGLAVPPPPRPPGGKVALALTELLPPPCRPLGGAGGRGCGSSCSGGPLQGG